MSGFMIMVGALTLGNEYSVWGTKLLENTRPWVIKLRYTIFGIFLCMDFTNHQPDFRSAGIWILIVVFLATLARIPEKKNPVSEDSSLAN